VATVDLIAKGCQTYTLITGVHLLLVCGVIIIDSQQHQTKSWISLCVLWWTPP